MAYIQIKRETQKRREAQILRGLRYYIQSGVFAITLGENRRGRFAELGFRSAYYGEI
jgi:hypothetical protein